jgi:hypothetical protein
MPPVRVAAGALAAAVLAAWAAPAMGQQPSPSPSPSPELQRPSPPPLDTRSRTVAIPASPRPSAPTSADAGALKDLRVLWVGAGEAQVSLLGAARRLRPGDVIAGDVVRSIGDGRLVLARADRDGGESTVVVAPDAQGRVSVRVISVRDRTAPKTER